MRIRRWTAAAGILLAAAGLAAAGWYLAGREPALPADARNALSSAVGVRAGGGAPRLQLLEIERIGPDFAVIYRLGGQTGAVLLVGGEGTWAAAGVEDPGQLVRPADAGVGAASLVADGLQVIFLGIPDHRVARVMVSFPEDGTVLTAQRRGRYAIVWRPAGAGPMSFQVETFDRHGNRLGR